MRLALAALVAGLFAGLTANPVAAQDAEVGFSSRYTLLEQCTEVDSSISPDYILNRCEGYEGIPIWWRYSDSARLFVGIGEVPHSSGFFGIDREHDWPIEWRGSESTPRFEPFAVIIRMRAPFDGASGEKDSFLTVFKLNPDGTSCVLESNIRDNEQARQVADRAPFRDCETMPHQYSALFE
ncbi:hypothetical protein [Erythrobacter alti]|uniref:hypothetical protein n=1 Tax=Erythrobacter alti TaxID=1896145 RepID=UPI0030F459DC